MLYVHYNMFKNKICNVISDSDPLQWNLLVHEVSLPVKELTLACTLEFKSSTTHCVEILIFVLSPESPPEIL